MTVAVGISAAIAAGITPPPWMAGGAFTALVVIFAPALIKPGPGRWRAPIDPLAARLLLGAGVVIAATGLTSVLLELPSMVTVAAAALLAGQTIGTTLSTAKRH